MACNSSVVISLYIKQSKIITSRNKSKNKTIHITQTPDSNTPKSHTLKTSIPNPITPHLVTSPCNTLNLYTTLNHKPATSNGPTINSQPHNRNPTTNNSQFFPQTIKSNKKTDIFVCSKIEIIWKMYLMQKMLKIILIG
ncbi:hypothetical protein J2783_003330 [Chryseobacterium sediminis]|nr:hypothetical protein [Chryseobacterium sediminis]